MKMRSLVLAFCLGWFSFHVRSLVAAEQAYAALLNGTQLPFYVFHAYQSPKNHYIPSGWMGDYGDIAFSDHFVDPKNRSHVYIRIAYSAKMHQGAGWAGIYWQYPANNWGTRPGGFNLNGAKKLRFLARGEKGGEVISEFKVGGITGIYSDSDAVSSGPITLTKDWQAYDINLENAELSSIAGGFCWTMSRDENPNGAVFYLDNIRFE